MSSGTGWVLDGRTVTAMYCDKKITGVVRDSRVKYGGRIGYTVDLTETITLPWNSEPKSYVLIEDSDIINVV